METQQRRSPQCPRAAAVSLCAACAVVLGTSAQPAPRPGERFPHISAFDLGYSVRYWGTDDGLPATRINSIAQTPDGFLWVGADGGLARFDGHRFRSAPTDLVSAGGNRNLRLNLESVFCDSRNRVWSCAQGRLFLYDNDGRLREPAMPSGAPRGPSLRVAETPNGRIYVVQASAKSVLLSWENHQGTLEKVAEMAQGAKAITGFVADKDGGLHIALDYGRLLAWDPRHGLRDLMYGGPGRFFKKPDGGVAYQSDGASYEFVDGKWRLAWADPGLSGRPAWAIEDLKGQIWAAVVQKGLYVIFPDGKIRRIFERESGLSAGVRTIFQDHEGSVWVGTEFGLFQLVRRPFLDLDLKGREPRLGVTSITEDAEGNLWFTGISGIGFLRPDGALVRHDAPPSADGVISGRSTVAGAWASDPIQGSLCRIDEDPRSWREWRNPWRHGPFTPGQMVETPSHEMWILCNGRVAFFKDEQWTPAMDGLPPNAAATALAQDAQGALIVSVAQNGLFRRTQHGVWEPMAKDAASTAPRRRIRRLCAASDGALWGVAGRNVLARWKDGRRADSERWIDQWPELHGIAADDHEGLWLTTEKDGVIWVDRSALAAEMDGQSRQAPGVRFFRKSDGLASGGCSVKPSGILKRRDGRVWVATNRGLSVADPAVWKALRESGSAPAVHLESVLIDGVETPLYRSPNTEHSNRPEPIVVPAGASRVELRFIGLDYTDPEHIRYRYRLEGLENHWIEGGSAGEANYQNLRPGRYRFHVISGNGRNVWNRDGASATILVAREWWETWWFQIGLAFAALGGAGYAYARRVRFFRRQQAVQQDFSRRLINAQEKERKRIANDLHDSLGHNLLVIKSGVVLTLRDLTNPKKARDRLNELIAVSDEAVAEVRQISHALRPMQLDELGLTKAITGMLRKVSEVSRFSVESKVDSVDDLLIPDVEISFFRVIQECLNNIHKHAGARKVNIRVTVERGEKINVSISDDGYGFNYEATVGPNGTAAGMGLRAMRERVRSMGGKIVIHSQPDVGTRVKFTIPVKRPWSHQGFEPRPS